MPVSDARVPLARTERPLVCIAVLLLACATAAPRNPDQLNPYTGDPAAVAEGKKLYRKLNCYACHGQSGGGGMGPSITDHDWKNGLGKGRRPAGADPKGARHHAPVWGRHRRGRRLEGDRLRADPVQGRPGKGHLVNGRGSPRERCQHAGDALFMAYAGFGPLRSGS